MFAIIQIMKIFAFTALFAAAVSAGVGYVSAQSGETADMAGLFDDWSADVQLLRKKRLGKLPGFSAPEEPDKNSLYWKARTEEDPQILAAVVDRFPDQLHIPVPFPDIDPLKEATPMHIAAVFNPNPDVLQKLSDGGGDVNATERDNGATPLHAALYANRSLPIIQKLVELGAEINAELVGGEYGGVMPLHLAAAKSDKPEVVVYLINNGADVRATFRYNFFNVTPLQALQSKGHDSVRGNAEVLDLLEK